MSDSKETVVSNEGNENNTNQSTHKSKGGFSGQIGFVLAAAGSAVGVGNLWRFPYLAAKDGGGVFIFIYLVLVVTFGFTLLTSDIALGRKTGKSSIYAYAELNKKWKFLGVLTFIVPVLIMTYYAVIGGWITKYMVVFMRGQHKAAAGDSFFTDFITSPVSPVIFGLLFMVITTIIVYNGVQGGIERCSRFIMPILLLLIIGISIYSLTLKHTDDNGVTRTGMEGLLVYLKPDFTGMTVKRFFQILLDAMSQLFFSLSVSMGIMITYGSYVKKDVNLNKSINQIEFFDTGVALLAGLMIIPAVYCFSGIDGMNAGPSLMFISLPKTFSAMGRIGQFVGLLFFIMAVFAALTSCISVLETVVANCMEIFHTSRKKTTLIAGIFYGGMTAVVALGYSIFYFEVKLPNGSVGTLLDIMDYISNSFLMPLISLLSSILIGWIVGPKVIVDEVESTGDKFTRKHLFVFMIKYVVPVIMFVLFLVSTGILDLFFKK
ncbi:MAG: sodium-dependent transporter [Lachnospiraceae bacterium]|nr:sodium-dependent transporter [Lachnospiraceae bacterium]